MRHSIRSKVRWFIAAGVFGMFALISPSETGRDAGEAQKRKPVFITRLYTGPDGQTHAEEIEAKFSGAHDAFRLMALTGGELHRAPAGRVGRSPNHESSGLSGTFARLLARSRRAALRGQRRLF